MTNNQAKQILAMIKQAKVVWKPLGEVAEIKKGKQLNKTELKDEGKYPAYNGGKNHSGWTDNYNVEADTVIISQGGASAGFVNFITTPFWANAHCYYLLPCIQILNNRYLYHFLKLNEKTFMESQHGAGIPALSQTKLSSFQIPIPPLELQKEIVKILDIFTELNTDLTTALETEHILRKKQYHYYQDFLLSETELAKVGFEWKTLGDITNLKRGKRLVRSELAEIGEYAVYQNSLQPLGYYHQANCPANSTFIITAGAAGEIGYSTVEFWAADDCYYLECPKGILNDRFLYHVLINQQQKILTQVRKASIPRLGRNSIENIKIPIPPLETQANIVAILDKFDRLTSSITDGLPKEIELRRKQYEYYRELLLGFDKPE